MRRTAAVCYKMPKNMGVAPRFDVWQERYEPWEHMRRMGRLAGTGFYIPPEWYNHFRMFPPISHNFQQEKTLNPHNESEPTQDGRGGMSAERLALRDELARKSRLVASEGMRYYNIFWVRKPLDNMEREYYQLKRMGVEHSEAVRRVLRGFYNELTVKKRVAVIQAEEAKLSGKFISMREATVVMSVLTQLQRDQLTPHQASLLARHQRDRVCKAETLTAAVSRSAASEPTSDTPATAVSAPSGATESMSADILADLMAEPEVAAESGTQYRVEIKDVPHDSVSALREIATDGTGSPHWYTGSSPVVG
jgi:hypothetical protein